MFTLSTKFEAQDYYLKHFDNHKEGLSFELYKIFGKTLKNFRKEFKNNISSNDI